jgi:hypothetical protein
VGNSYAGVSNNKLFLGGNLAVFDLYERMQYQNGSIKSCSSFTTDTVKT